MEKDEVTFRELSPQELISVSGGDPIGTLLKRVSPWAALIGIVIYVYDNWDQFADGVKEGYESTQNQ